MATFMYFDKYKVYNDKYWGTYDQLHTKKKEELKTICVRKRLPVYGNREDLIKRIFASYKKADLKIMCESKDLDVNGDKEDLIKRISENYKVLMWRRECLVKGLYRIKNADQFFDRVRKTAGQPGVVNQYEILYGEEMLIEDDPIEDDTGKSDIDKSKVLGDTAGKEDNSVENGNIYKEKEVTQVNYKESKETKKRGRPAAKLPAKVNKKFDKECENGKPAAKRGRGRPKKSQK